MIMIIHFKNFIIAKIGTNSIVDGHISMTMEHTHACTHARTEVSLFLYQCNVYV